MHNENNDLLGKTVVSCTPDARDARTVSFYCPHCRYRHEHGNPGRYTEPGQLVGDRVAHCYTIGRTGERFSEYSLVIGEEQWQPVKRRRTRRVA